MRARGLAVLSWCVAALVGACASAPPAALRTAVLPTDLGVQRASVARLARELFEAMQTQHLEGVLVGRGDLDELLTPEARLRTERERAALDGDVSRASLKSAWAAASYAGFCAQGARQEPAGGGYGLRQGASVVDRLLVVADAGTRRSASWIEGRFVYTDRGFRALSLSRVEEPRAHHTDLEVAPCDVEQGIR